MKRDPLLKRKPVKAQSTIKKGRLLKWTFQGKQQATLKAYAEMGASNQLIMERLPGAFSRNELNYARAKAQKVEGKKGGYMRGWANGTSALFRQFERDALKVLVEDTQRHLPQLILHPTPETVNIETP
jgi:hypothetical protein